MIADYLSLIDLTREYLSDGAPKAPQAPRKDKPKLVSVEKKTESSSHFRLDSPPPIPQDDLTDIKKQLSGIAIISEIPGKRARIVIYAPNINSDERTLLTHLADALSKKVAPTEYVATQEAIGSPRLLLTTETIETTIPTLLLTNLKQYIDEPEQKRTLWAEITTAYQ